MSQRITYYYAIASGFAYVGEPELRRIAALANVEIDYRPVDIQRVFAESGTTPPPRQSEIRRAYRGVELARWGKRRNLPINIKPAFWPVDVEAASRAVLAAKALGIDPGGLSFAFLRAVWVEDRNIAEAETVRAIIEAEAPTGQAELLLKHANEDVTADRYDTISEEAVKAGVFGSPTFFIEGDMFFGQDRLDMIAEILGVAEGNHRSS